MHMKGGGRRDSPAGLILGTSFASPLLSGSAELCETLRNFAKFTMASRQDANTPCSEGIHKANDFSLQQVLSLVQ